MWVDGTMASVDMYESSAETETNLKVRDLGVEL